MKRASNYFIILFHFIQLGCTSDRNKSTHISTIQVCGKALSVEKYTIWGGGAYGGDRVSDYLTDSTTFRMYVGTFDNAHENYTYECKGDSVYIERVSIEEEGIPYNTKSIVEVIERRAVDLKTLRKQNKFE